MKVSLVNDGPVTFWLQVFSIETVLKFAGATISSSSRSFEWLSSRCRMPGGW